MHPQNETKETIKPMIKENDLLIQILNKKNRACSDWNNNNNNIFQEENTLYSLEKIVLILILISLNIFNVITYGINVFKGARR